jgi:hypothetical protein
MGRADGALYGEGWVIPAIYGLRYRPESVLEKFEELTSRTEKWMNEQYKIDYRVEEVEGKRWMAVLLHKENPGSNYHFRIQQYIDAKVFPGISSTWQVENDRSRQPAGFLPPPGAPPFCRRSRKSRVPGRGWRWYLVW